MAPLGERGLDALREIFNIGAGSAATSLSQMLGGERVSVEVPNIQIIPTSGVPMALGGGKRIVCAVGFTISGGLDARLLLILEQSSARRLAAVLLGRPLPADGEHSTAGLDDAERSALDETGNILASSFVGGLGKLTNRRIMPSVPSSGFDDVAIVVDAILANLGSSSLESIVCRTDFTTRGTRIQGHLLLLPDRQSLSAILSALGVDPST